MRLGGVRSLRLGVMGAVGLRLGGKGSLPGGMVWDTRPQHPDEGVTPLRLRWEVGSKLNTRTKDWGVVG